MDGADDPALKALELAKQAFRKKMTNSRAYDQILNNTTIHDVCSAIFKIQQDMSKKGRLKYLSRIEPFISRLKDFQSVIEVFVSSKAEVLALIWGPIKLILLWATELLDVMDAIVSAMERISEALPRFATLARAFRTSDVIKAALALFYEDILDFFATILDVLQTKRNLKQQFAALWKTPKKKVDVIISNLEKHRRLLTEEVTFLDISEAKEARTRSFEHFAEARASELSRKYSALKAAMVPPQYQDRLSWLQERSVPDCDAWLLCDAGFLGWKDPSQQSTELFWLHGDPGAGKTYLSASIISTVKTFVGDEGRVIFAFVSYTNSRWLSARSVILGLLFQAADEDTDLRSVLVQTPEREFRENAGQVTLLKNFLLTAPGTTYIIIDGLDEMDEDEQQILLREFDGISHSCENLRLLISSRMEHNISRTLDEKAIGVRVDKMNFGSIQTYIDHRCDRWISEGQFAPEIERELRELIAPLSALADGMFLYARIVLDNVEHVGSIEEVRHELRAPPKSLKHAYHRIFDRINRAKPIHRERARKVLGWVGCAPAPLTRYEMEQALSISVRPESQSSRLPRLLGKTEFVKLCGPIVEVVGDQVQFVHFTAQEYLFSKDIPNFIHSNQATADLARSLLAYLGTTGVLDTDLDNHEIDENILNGNYRLFEYAYVFWPTLFRQVHPTRDNATSLGELLHTIIQEGGTNASTQEPDEVPRLAYKNLHLERSLPDVYRIVCETFHFRLSDKRWDWSQGDSSGWVHLDPLVTSEMLVRIQERRGALAVEPMHQASLQLHYGVRLFGCTFPFCPQSYRGFESQKDRTEHMIIHGRPWKCSIPSCDFSSIGFQTKQRRDDHWMKLHLPDPSQLTAGRFDPDRLNAAEAQSVLFMLVSDKNVDDAKRLLAAPVGKKLKSETLLAARRIAAKTGCFAMTELLAPSTEIYKPYDIVVAAVKSRDAAFAKAYIDMSNPSESAQIMKSIVGIESEEMYLLWEAYILAIPQNELVRTFDGRPERFYDQLFKGVLFRAVKDKPWAEARLTRALRKASDELTYQLLGTFLVRVAKSSCSVRLARELIALGASVDYPNHGASMTALHIAAKKTSQEAAFFMKYLIGEGAACIGEEHRALNDPERIGVERGALKMEEYVGQTFEELRLQSYLKRVGADPGSSSQRG